jgi:hypothetical protein
MIDIDLQVVAGAVKGNEVPLGDGVDQNDVTLAAPQPGANPDAGYGSKLKALALQGSDEPVPAAAESSDEGGGTSAIVWVVIGVGALVLVATAFAVGRGRTRTA